MKKILIVGATGYLGSHLVAACRKAGNETHALVRSKTQSDEAKMAPLRQNDAVVHTGELEDYQSLLAACQDVDAVISAAGGDAIGLQGELIRAAKDAGIGRFMPSDFGVDPKVVGPGACVLVDGKAAVQQAVKDAGIEYTFLNANCFMSFWAAGLGQLGLMSPPEEVSYFGNGDVPVCFTNVPDVAAVALRVLTDPRAANQEVSILVNPTTQEALIQEWERISGTSVKRIPVSEEQVKAVIKDATTPERIMELIVTQLTLSAFIRGKASELGAGVLNAPDLYPDMTFTTIHEFFQSYVKAAAAGKN
jgi:uncharacterized protein YbjT (DUF2867 family)